MVSRWGGWAAESLSAVLVPSDCRICGNPASYDFAASGVRRVPCFPASDRRLRVLSPWGTNIVSLRRVRNRRRTTPVARTLQVLAREVGNRAR